MTVAALLDCHQQGHPGIRCSCRTTRRFHQECCPRPASGSGTAEWGEDHYIHQGAAASLESVAGSVIIQAIVTGSRARGTEYCHQESRGICRHSGQGAASAAPVLQSLDTAASEQVVIPKLSQQQHYKKSVGSPAAALKELRMSLETKPDELEQQPGHDVRSRSATTCDDYHCGVPDQEICRGQGAATILQEVARYGRFRASTSGSSRFAAAAALQEIYWPSQSWSSSRLLQFLISAVEQSQRQAPTKFRKSHTTGMALSNIGHIGDKMAMSLLIKAWFVPSSPSWSSFGVIWLLLVFCASWWWRQTD
jgi:hypothetical protein